MFFDLTIRYTVRTTLNRIEKKSPKIYNQLPIKPKNTVRVGDTLSKPFTLTVITPQWSVTSCIMFKIVMKKNTKKRNNMATSRPGSAK